AVVSQVALSYISSSKRSHARLAFLAEASRVLGSSLDGSELPARVAQLAVPKIADACLIYLVDDNGALQQPVSVSTSHNSGQEKTGAPGSSLDMALWVKQILARRRPVLIAELRDGDDYGLLCERERDRTLRQ